MESNYLESKVKFTIYYVWNDCEYYEPFDDWTKAMLRYWKLVEMKRNPQMGFD